MSSNVCYSEYDVFAQIYNEEWGQNLSDNALLSLEKLLIPNLHQGANIFDLCCGTGQLVKELLDKGYQVTGLDGSEAMLYFARQNAPQAQFIRGDARFFEISTSFDAIISTSAALNHVMELDELIGVFHKVYTALLPDGKFLFDMNLDERYRSSLWNTMQGNVTKEYAWAIQQTYFPDEKIGRLESTVFQLVSGIWQRSDSTWLVRGYLKTEILSALEKVGFKVDSVCDAQEDFGITGKAGNAYFLCHK
jgi:SAM-dependent methyltransferase